MNRIGRALLNYLIKGLLVVVPIALSIFIVVWAVTTVDGWLNVNNILAVDERTHSSRNIPGLGLALVIAIILLAGIFVTNFVTEPMYNWFKRIVNRLPLINFIYSSIKDLTEAFVGDEKKFNTPVVVEVEAGLKKNWFFNSKRFNKIELTWRCSCLLSVLLFFCRTSLCGI